MSEDLKEQLAAAHSELEHTQDKLIKTIDKLTKLSSFPPNTNPNARDADVGIKCAWCGIKKPKKYLYQSIDNDKGNLYDILYL